MKIDVHPVDDLQTFSPSEVAGRELINDSFPGRGGGKDSHMKKTGMLVSLRGVNFGFWSPLGCSGQSANILSRQGLV